VLSINLQEYIGWRSPRPYIDLAVAWSLGRSNEAKSTPYDVCLTSIMKQVARTVRVYGHAWKKPFLLLVAIRLKLTALSMWSALHDGAAECRRRE
jgi:hypothetical protein